MEDKIINQNLNPENMYKCQYINVHFWPNKHVQFTHS